MKTPITQDSLKQTRTYSWWKYVLVVFGAVLGWNLIFSVTAYRSPPEKRLDFYAEGYADADAVDAYLQTLRAEELSDMEEVNFLSLISDDYYTDIQLTTYIAAGEGDIYLLSAGHFQSFASSGALVALEEQEALTAAALAAGTALDKGWRTESGSHERHLFGIPADKLTGFAERFQMNTTDKYLCIIVTNGNDENAVKMLQLLVRDMAASPTDLPGA